MNPPNPENLENTYLQEESQKFTKMIENVHNSAHQTNPRLLCLNCWSLETRTTKNYIKHKNHVFEPLPNMQVTL